METEQHSYLGFECESCGESFEVEGPIIVPFVMCPHCGERVEDKASVVYGVTDMSVETGFYECFDCGHLFGYSATELENSDSMPNCTECGSDNVSDIVS